MLVLELDLSLAITDLKISGHKRIQIEHSVCIGDKTAPSEGRLILLPVVLWLGYDK